MHDQPKYVPLRESSFFDDARSARPLVAGTVARGHLRDDTLLYTGKAGKADATRVPVSGRRTGDGARAGALQHLLLAVPRAHRARATGWSSGAATGGRRRITRIGCATRRSGTSSTSSPTASARCPTTPSQIKAADRWAIVAYIRALQLSEHATLDDVPPRRARTRSADASHANGRRSDSRAGAATSARLLLAGGAGLLVSLVGWFLNPTQFFQSYLMAYMLCLGVTLGCLALGMVHQLSGGAWGVVHPAADRRRGARAAGADAALPADRARHVAPLSVDARRRSWRTTRCCSTSSCI